MPTFDTTDPVELSVRLGAGSITVAASDTTSSTVDLVPRDETARALLERATVDRRDRTLVVDVPRGGGRSSGVDITVTVPAGSDVHVTTDSADTTLTGRYGTLVVKTGSGDVRIEHTVDTTQIGTGSGDVRLDHASGPLEVGTGSGDVEIGAAEDAVSLKTGSGELRVRRAAAAVELKSGSGDLVVDDAGGDVVLKSGSGDLTVGRVGASRVQATNASGSIQVGVAADLPAWLDLSTVTGRITSDLDPAEPADGEPFAEIHAKTVSGDVVVGRA